MSGTFHFKNKVYISLSLHLIHLSFQHGMGIPSLSIVFHEILKLLHHAGATDVKFFRLGTSGGLGLEPGSVVISQTAKDGLLRPYMEVVSIIAEILHC